MKSFYTRDGDHYVATPLCRGPWDDRFQHGGPPAALLGGHLQRHGDDAADFFVARVTLELYSPVPIATLAVEITPERMGRTVQRLSAALTVAGKTVALARAVRIRRVPLAVPDIAAPLPWPEPESVPSVELPLFDCDVGYHKAVEMRLCQGRWGTTPVGFWARPRVPLVAGRPSSALERLLILADAQSGMGVPVDPKRYTFVNPDLTVYLERDSVGDWLGFDIRSTASSDGVGLAQSAIRDSRGVFARSAQSLVVTARG